MMRKEPSAPKRLRPTRQRGLALVVVLWAAILLALIASGVARLSRSDLNLAHNLVESTRAELAADSALWTAVYRIVNGGPDAWRIDGTVYTWRIGEAEVRVQVTDELGRIDINIAPPELLAALFVAAGTAPADAERLAETVVEFRNEIIDNRLEPAAGRPSVGPGIPFALADGLAQVPGMPPELMRRIAPAITVYTGEAQPRPETASPLVLAAIDGRALDAPEGDEPEPRNVIAATAETESLGDSPEILGQAVESEPVRSGLLRIQAEAFTDGGSYFAREAVIAILGRSTPPYRFRLWQRGARILFPDQAESG